MNLRNSTTTTGLKQQIYPYQKNKKRFDEDGVSGFINPIMIDEKYQGNHYAENAMTIAIDILKMRESTAQTSTTFEFIEAVLCPFNEFSANESESYTYLVKILSSLYKIPCLSCWNIHPSGTENS